MNLAQNIFDYKLIEEGINEARIKNINIEIVSISFIHIIILFLTFLGIFSTYISNKENPKDSECEALKS